MTDSEYNSEEKNLAKSNVKHVTGGDETAIAPLHSLNPV